MLSVCDLREKYANVAVPEHGEDYSDRLSSAVVFQG